MTWLSQNNSIVGKIRYARDFISKKSEKHIKDNSEYEILDGDENESFLQEQIRNYIFLNTALYEIGLWNCFCVVRWLEELWILSEKEKEILDNNNLFSQLLWNKWNISISKEIEMFTILFYKKLLDDKVISLFWEKSEIIKHWIYDIIEKNYGSQILYRIINLDIELINIFDINEKVNSLLSTPDTKVNLVNGEHSTIDSLPITEIEKYALNLQSIIKEKFWERIDNNFEFFRDNFPIIINLLNLNNNIDFNNDHTIIGSLHDLKWRIFTSLRKNNRNIRESIYIESTEVTELIKEIAQFLSIELDNCLKIIKKVNLSELKKVFIENWINFEVTNNLEVTESDFNMLKYIFNELIRNTEKYAKEWTIKVEVCYNEDKYNNVTISIENTIDSHQKKKINSNWIWINDIQRISKLKEFNFSINQTNDKFVSTISFQAKQINNKE